jgi:hypothetical protein
MCHTIAYTGFQSGVWPFGSWERLFGFTLSKAVFLASFQKMKDHSFFRALSPKAIDLAKTVLLELAMM